MDDKLNLGDLELDIFKLSNHDRSFLVKMLGCLDQKYFESKILSKLFFYYKGFFRQFDSVPTRKIIKDWLTKNTEETENFIEGLLVKIYDDEDVNELDKKYILEEVTLFAKRARMKDAILNSVELLNEDKFPEIINMITEALKFNINVNLGFDLYDVDERYRLLLSNNEKMETGYKTINDLLGGGWTRKEIFCVMGPPAVGKSIFLVNFGFHALVNGYNVVHYSFEMSEERLGMRYDAVATHIDQHQLKDSLDDIKQRYKMLQSIRKSHLKIKEFPTALATVFDIEAHLEQLKMYENFIPDIIIVDYGDIMRSTRTTKNPYEEQGWIFRELRGLAIKWNVTLLTATQARRDALDPKGGTKEVVGQDQVADSIEKNRILDVLFSIVQSKKQKDAGKISLFTAKNRNGISGNANEYFINYSNFAITEDVAAQTKGKGMKVADEELAIILNQQKHAYREDDNDEDDDT